MVYGYHLHMDRRGVRIPGQHHGSVFEEDHFLGAGGDAGGEVGIGGCGKGERGTACEAAAGHPQRPRSAVYLR